MEIILNGEPKVIDSGTTIATLIEDLGLAQAICAAEVNKAVVPKREHAERLLSEGDRVELVTLVGGG